MSDGGSEDINGRSDLGLLASLVMNGACLSSKEQAEQSTLSKQRYFGGSVTRRDDSTSETEDSMKRMKCWRRQWSAVDSV